jgi:hypothetical protein
MSEVYVLQVSQIGGFKLGFQHDAEGASINQDFFRSQTGGRTGPLTSRYGSTDMGGWSKEDLGAHVDVLAREHEGEAFVSAVGRFGHEDLDPRERRLLHDVLMERALRGLVNEAARERRRSGWTRRLLEGRLGRRPPGAPAP